MFLVMGLGVLLVWNAMTEALPFEAYSLLIVGGGAYIFGIVFFVLGEYKPIYHVIWHLFVVLGAALHWFTVYLFIVNTELGGALIEAGHQMMKAMEQTQGVGG
jgi:hemolysin III